MAHVSLSLDPLVYVCPSSTKILATPLEAAYVYTKV